MGAEPARVETPEALLSHVLVLRAQVADLNEVLAEEEAALKGYVKERGSAVVADGHEATLTTRNGYTTDRGMVDALPNGARKAFFQFSGSKSTLDAAVKARQVTAEWAAQALQTTGTTEALKISKV